MATPQDSVRAQTDRTEMSGAMTRSEEELVLTTEWRVAEVVRVRKRIVTEERTITVPVRREELVLEHDIAPPGTPIPEGFEAAPREQVMVLSEEEVVVDTRIVAKERVRIVVETMTSRGEVIEEVRKERIDIENEWIPVAE